MNDYDLPNSIHNQICQRLGWKVCVSKVDGGGLSSARIWHIESTGVPNNPMYCLKGVDSGSMTIERMIQIHRVMESAHSQECDFVPKLLRWSSGASYLVEDGFFWELTSWLPGMPVQSVGAVTRKQIEEGMVAVGKLHRRLQDLGIESRRSPGIARRLEGLQQLTAQRLGYLDRKVETIEDFVSRSALSQILRSVGKTKRELEAYLTQASTADFPCQWILRDLWREHVLFVGDTVTGIIDYGATQIDWPGFDLVRLLGTWLVPGDSRWAEAIERYNMTEAGNCVSSRIVVALDRVATLLSGIQWIEWLSDGVFDINARGGRARLRIQELAARLDV